MLKVKWKRFYFFLESITIEKINDKFQCPKSESKRKPPTTLKRQIKQYNGISKRKRPVVWIRKHEWRVSLDWPKSACTWKGRDQFTSGHFKFSSSSSNTTSRQRHRNTDCLQCSTSSSKFHCLSAYTLCRSFSAISNTIAFQPYTIWTLYCYDSNQSLDPQSQKLSLISPKNCSFCNWGRCCCSRWNGHVHSKIAKASRQY